MHGQGNRGVRKIRDGGVLRSDCRRCRKTQTGRPESEASVAKRRTELWLGGSAARRLGGSAARRLGGSAARRLGAAARRLGGSAARRLGGSADIVPATPDANVKRRDDPSPVSPAPAATPATPPFADTLRPAGGPLPFIVVVIAPLRFSSSHRPPGIHSPRQIFAHPTFENGNACTAPTEAPCSRRSPRSMAIVLDAPAAIPGRRRNRPCRAAAASL